MYKVKLTFPYPEWNIRRQTPSSRGIWGNCEFFINDKIEECDYWFVFDHLLQESEVTKCPQENTVLLTGEPFEVQKYGSECLEQFHRIITCQREIKHPRITYLHQGHPWFVGARYRDGHYVDFSKSYDELMQLNEIKKTKSISLITSDKQVTEGHKRRYRFAMDLKEYFGDTIDLFGRGIKDFQDKWDVLADYKYSIAIENSVCPDWMTEKLYDCFMAHTYPLYYGCPNVGSYFEKDAYSVIDINDFDGTCKKIEGILAIDQFYESHLPKVIEAKQRYLNRYNIFPLIDNFISEHGGSMGKAKEIVLHNRPLMHLPVAVRLFKKLKNVIRN